jgi:hypothetical protein
VAIEVKNAEVIVRAVREKLERMKAKLEPVLQDEVTRMVLRTRQGRDVNGQPFAPYTPAYNAFKASHKSGVKTRTGKPGKKAKQVKGAFSAIPQTPDLTLSGNMLAAITIEVRDEGNTTMGRVFFNSALEAAKARGNMEKRDFFGFSNDQVVRIKRRLTENT